MNDKDLAAAYKKQRDDLLKFIQTAQVSSGVCCCGDDMKAHASPMICGHNPVDMWDHAVITWTEDIAKLDAGTMTTDDPEYTVVNPPGPPLTDTQLIAALEARASQEFPSTFLHNQLTQCGRVLKTDAQHTEVRAMLADRNPDNYDDWTAAGAALKATGYDFAFVAWKNWSQKSPKYDWTKLNEAWVSFPRAPEPKA